MISPSQICLLCLSFLCQLRESRSSAAAAIWACKYPLWLISKLKHCATGSLSLSLNKVRIRGKGVGMFGSVWAPKTKWDLFVCSSTVRSTIEREWAGLWCITVQCLCVCVRVQPCLRVDVYYEANPPALYMFSLWLMKHLKSREKDSGYSTQGWLTSLLSALNRWFKKNLQHLSEVGLGVFKCWQQTPQIFCPHQTIPLVALDPADSS